MFASKPNNLKNTNNKEATTKYLDLWKLEIFLFVCLYDYIGDASVDTYIIMQYVYIQIAQLKQSWINNGKYTTSSPNDLFLVNWTYSKPYIQCINLVHHIISRFICSTYSKASKKYDDISIYNTRNSFTRE